MLNVLAFAVLLSAPGAVVVTAQMETTFVKFICTSAPAVVEVVVRVDDLIYGLSPLPTGCTWLPFNTTGTVFETVQHIRTPDGRTARVSRVVVGGRKGFSAGLVEHVS